MSPANKGIDPTSQVLGYHESQRARVMPNTLGLLMQQHLWWTPMSAKECPPWPCPKCGSGHLQLDADTFRHEETAESAAAHNVDDWEPEYIEYLFTAWGSCSNRACGQRFSMSGTGSVDTGQDHEGVYWYDTFHPRSCSPMPLMIDIPAKCPEPVIDSIRSASELFWVSPSSAANATRIAVERLLDYMGVDGAAPGDESERRWKPLDARIKELAATDKLTADQLMAIKWLGNTGSHSVELAKWDVLDGLEVLEHVLDRLIGQRSARVQDLVNRINSAHNPAES